MSKLPQTYILLCIIDNILYSNIYIYMINQFQLYIYIIIIIMEIIRFRLFRGLNRIISAYMQFCPFQLSLFLTSCDRSISKPSSSPLRAQETSSSTEAASMEVPKDHITTLLDNGLFYSAQMLVCVHVLPLPNPYSPPSLPSRRIGSALPSLFLSFPAIIFRF